MHQPISCRTVIAATGRSCIWRNSHETSPREGVMADANGKPINLLSGNTFVVSDSRGDIDDSLGGITGLFASDTRFLSRWLLTIDGQVPQVLSTDDCQYGSAQFFLVPDTGTVYVDAELVIIRMRTVGHGFHEDMNILNLSPKSVNLEVRVAAGSDFADLFAVKDKLT